MDSLIDIADDVMPYVSLARELAAMLPRMAAPL